MCVVYITTGRRLLGGYFSLGPPDVDNKRVSSVPVFLENNQIDVEMEMLSGPFRARRYLNLVMIMHGVGGVGSCGLDMRNVT